MTTDPTQDDLLALVRRRLDEIPAGERVRLQQQLRSLGGDAQAEAAGDDRRARDASEAASRRIGFLYQATSTLFSGPLDFQLRLGTLAKLAVPDLADWCVVDVRASGDAAGYERVALSHWDPDAETAAATRERRSFPLDATATSGVPRVLTRGSPEFVPDVAPTLSAALARSADPLLATVGARSYMIVPLAGDGHPLATITFAFAESNRRYDADDLALASDLSRRAELALDNARLYEQAQAALRTREDLLAIVSHDLRNPLSAISTGAVLLGRAEATPESAASTRRVGERIQRAAQRMELLIRDLLSFASIQAGRLTLEPKPNLVDALVREAVEAIAPQAAPKGVAVETELDADAGNVVLLCDRPRVLQVFSNLLGNAVKFSQDGGPVRLRVRRAAGEVRFEIQDSGPGIPTDALPRIFERYWRVERTGQEGTGLGLFIARGIVEAHRGKIWAESALGRGSTFVFTLPM